MALFNKKSGAGQDRPVPRHIAIIMAFITFKDIWKLVA